MNRTREPKRTKWALGAMLLAAAFGAAAFAQLPALPPLPGLPSLPPVVDEVKSALPGVEDLPSASDLRDLRKNTLRSLLRQHRDVIDTDRSGDAIVRAEALALSPTPEALDRARAAGFTITRRTTLEGLGTDIVILRAPDGVSTRDALDRLRALDPGGVYDFNHLYTGSGEPIVRTSAPAASTAPPKDVNARIGLIDGGVDTQHRALAGATIVTKSFAGPSTPSAHGTAVASLIAGRDGAFVGAAPGAQIFAADVFGAAPTGGSAEQLVQAFAWMVQEKVPIVNASIVGPPNRALESVVRTVIAKKIIIVAAVGNDGPSAPPLYPAAYPGVIGVTGVDAKRRVLVEAERGAQVDFAAPGDLIAAQPNGAYAQMRGTSFAAPIVAGLLARQAESELIAGAIDLGAKGRDNIYGYGLVGESVRADPRVMASR